MTSTPLISMAGSKTKILLEIRKDFNTSIGVVHRSYKRNISILHVTALQNLIEKGVGRIRKLPHPFTHCTCMSLAEGHLISIRHAKDGWNVNH